MAADWITAVGGPLDGRDWPVRFPDGLVLVNKPAGEALVYERHTDRLIAKQIVPLDAGKALDAAENELYDVLAYDEAVMGAWQR